MVKGLGDFLEGRATLREWWLDIGTTEAGQQEDSKDSLKDEEAQHNKKGELNPDLEPASAPKERISAQGAIEPEVMMEPKVADQFGSLDSSLCSSHPKPAVEAPSKGQADATVGSRPVLSKQRGGVQPLMPNTSATLDGAHNVFPTPNRGEDQHPGNLKQSPRTLKVDWQEAQLSKNIKEMFSRASNIIRDCIEVDGTIFLDASIGVFGGDIDESHTTHGPSELMGGQNQEYNASSAENAGNSESLEGSLADRNGSQRPKKTLHDGDDDDDDYQQKTCGVLGFSIGGKSSLRGDEASEGYNPVAEAFLQKLLHKYPHGHVFNLDEGDPRKNDQVSQPRSRKSRKSTKQAEAKALLQMLPGALSVVLFPLWDSHRGRWFAASFVWTTRSTRTLTHPEDLSYLAAFGNSIMADVAQLDTMASDRAKSDFISSISHELRSPLHGILASVEFLQNTTVDLFQNSMIDTIERCGRTLLDTIQHVLDFAKINNFTRPKTNKQTDEGSSSKNPPSKRIGLSVDIDLSMITEDVIYSVHAGHVFQGNSSLLVDDEVSGFPSEGLRRTGSSDNTAVPGPPAFEKKQLETILDIDWRSNWAFNTQSGALRRVVMNLFGNALKYTDAGWVKISLRSEDIKPTSPSHPHPQPLVSIITIIVSDSGRGISQEFMHSHIFTPFTQENPLNSGTGLGLSIVLQIVRSLGGTIDITNVSETSSMPNIKPGASSLKASLEDMCTMWFNMKVTAPQSWQASPPDIYIANEKPEPYCTDFGAPVIVLCSNASVYHAYAQGSQHDDKRLVYFISKPEPSVESEPLSPTTDVIKARRRNPVLLLVEDNEINMKLLETFTRKNGYEYDTAVNGQLALEAFQNAQYFYDIVFMGKQTSIFSDVAILTGKKIDISMPVMNGMDSTRGIRKLERARGQKPATIIALTGLASADIRQEAFSSGMNLFLTKPVRFNELRKILDDWSPDMEQDITSQSNVGTDE
ncbi:uncharacterized protein GIQ15_04319 [Arthroderma uncinatum]|uniref:uncharacterized protein n=1 Tax=Arthroderma uncinatum TaxID=74035 RepID=UPI00144AE3CE|nr:uncharacterized protein GIQ15_04319 [Arthroderma uncinatum]KAF3481560.1 hypothetical protein GIQ15_04319 [Arthroderma uncinatum]